MNNPISASGTSCKVIHDIHELLSEQLSDWGSQPNCLDGQSLSRGLLLYKGVDNKPESGFWECTPGTWSLEIPRDEFCHFLSGEAVYTSEKGENIHVRAGSCVLFQAGWRGTCKVKSTIRNVYMLTA